jgi:hypothetical protein
MTGRWYGQTVAGAREDPNASATLSRALDSSPSSGSAAFLQHLKAQGEDFRYFGYDPGYLVNDNWGGGYRTHFRKSIVQSLLVLNRAITLGLDDVQGYNPVQIGRYSELFTAVNGYNQEYHEANVFPSGISSPLLNLLNAKYIIVPKTIPAGRPDLLHMSQRYPTVYEDRQVRILENRSALGRAWITHDAVTVKKDEVLPLLASGAVDPESTVVLEVPAPDVQPASDPENDSVTINDLSDDAIRLSTTTSARGILVVSDAYDSNWKAYVDGDEVDILVADYALRGIPIAAGNHVVEMRYESLTLRIGLVISAIVAMLALSIAILVGMKFLRRNKHPVSL